MNASTLPAVPLDGSSATLRVVVYTRSTRNPCVRSPVQALALLSADLFRTLAGPGEVLQELKSASGEGQDGAERSASNSRLPRCVHVVRVGVADLQHAIKEDAMGAALRFQP